MGADRQVIDCSGYGPTVYSGDWHGRWNDAVREIKRIDLSDVLLIQVGDFGAGFDRPSKFEGAMRMLDQTLSGRNIRLLAIRGNHDDPSYFDGRQYGNVRLLRDYTTVLVSGGRRVLCVGGAVSVDRLPNPDVRDYRGSSWKGRRPGSNYWPDEPFRLEHVEEGSADCVVTHSAPAFCFPLHKVGIEKWCRHDPQLERDIRKERAGLAALADQLGPGVSEWRYGHFHSSSTQVIGTTRYRCLDELEFSE